MMPLQSEPGVPQLEMIEDFIPFFLPNATNPIKTMHRSGESTDEGPPLRDIIEPRRSRVQGKGKIFGTSWASARRRPEHGRDDDDRLGRGRVVLRRERPGPQEEIDPDQSPAMRRSARENQRRLSVDQPPR